MSQLEDSPSGLLQHFGDALSLRMEGLDEDSLAHQLVLAVVTIAYAAGDTAHALERQGERNESA